MRRLSIPLLPLVWLIAAHLSAWGAASPDTAGDLCYVPEVRLARFEVTADAAGTVSLVWETTLELGSGMFRVLRQETGALPDEREVARLVTCCDEEGGVYRVKDALARVGEACAYTIRFLPRNGTETELAVWQGTIRVSDRTTAAAVAPSPVTQSSAPAAVQRWIGEGPRVRVWDDPEPADRVRVSLTEAGVYSVTLQELSEASGWPVDTLLSDLEATNLCVQCQGNPIAWLADGPRLIFHALPAASRFAPENVYWISRNPGLTMSESHQVPSVPAVTNAWFTDRIERQGTEWLGRISYSTLTNAHIPFTGYRTLSGGGSSYILTNTLTDCASGDWSGAVTVRLLSRYDGEDGGDTHLACLAIGDSTLGDIAWTNEAYQVATFPFASASAPDGTLFLTLTNAATPPPYPLNDFTKFSCLSYAIDYARRYVARDDRLRCTGGSGSLAAITHFTTNDVLVLDVTDAARPLCVTGCEQLQDAATGLWSVSFACGDATRIYRLASNSKGLLQPAVRGVRDTDWGAPAQATPHVILIPPEAWRSGFRQAVEPLRAFRTSQGIPSRIVDVEALYNAFSDGLVDPEAIRAFCSAMRPNGLTYLLLAGAGAVDFKHHRLSVTDYSSCLIPTLIAGQRMAQTGEGEGIIVALDGALGDTDGDGRPDVAVGRLPTSQTQQVTTVVGKTIAYETRPPRTKRPVALVADWENVYPKDYDFSNGIDRLQEPLRRAGRSVMRHVLPDGNSGTAARKTFLFPALQAGAGLFHFFGHSNESSLGDGDRFLSIANIQPGNWRIPPTSVVIACRANRWHGLTPTQLILPFGLFATDTGFAGCLGATGNMRAREGEELAVALFTPDTGEQTVTLGKVWLRGMRSMAGKIPQERLLCFSLIGDPALRFGVPPYPGTAVSVR